MTDTAAAATARVDRGAMAASAVLELLAEGASEADVAHWANAFAGRPLSGDELRRALARAAALARGAGAAPPAEVVAAASHLRGRGRLKRMRSDAAAILERLAAGETRAEVLEGHPSHYSLVVDEALLYGALLARFEEQAGRARPPAPSFLRDALPPAERARIEAIYAYRGAVAPAETPEATLSDWRRLVEDVEREAERGFHDYVATLARRDALEDTLKMVAPASEARLRDATDPWDERLESSTRDAGRSILAPRTWRPQRWWRHRVPERPAGELADRLGAAGLLGPPARPRPTRPMRPTEGIAVDPRIDNGRQAVIEGTNVTVATALGYLRVRPSLDETAATITAEYGGREHAGRAVRADDLRAAAGYAAALARSEELSPPAAARFAREARHRGGPPLEEVRPRAARILEKLAEGLSVEEIAARDEGLTPVLVDAATAYGADLAEDEPLAPSAPEPPGEAALRDALTPADRRLLDEVWGHQAQWSAHQLEYTVERFRRFVEEVEEGYGCMLPEYDNDLDGRGSLERVIGLFSPSSRRRLLPVVAPLDERFDAATRALERPVWGPYVGDPPWWWLYRIPTRPEGRLRKDLEAFGLI